MHKLSKKKVAHQSLDEYINRVTVVNDISSHQVCLVPPTFFYRSGNLCLVYSRYKEERGETSASVDRKKTHARSYGGLARGEVQVISNAAVLYGFCY